MNNQKVVIVTGTSRGIGKAIALYLHEKNYKIIGIDKTEVPQVFTQVTCDLKNWEEASIAIKKVIEEGSNVVGLINNAAIQIEKGILDTSLENLNEIFSTNVFSIYLLTQLLGPYFSQDAAIVNISSVHAHATSRNLSSYVATKGAVSALTRSMALELGEEKGIRVNSICPGAIETEMLIQGLSRNSDPDQAMNNLKKSSPLNKIGSGADVAKLVHFLIDGELSGNITGQEFVVDSGVLARLASE